MWGSALPHSSPGSLRAIADSVPSPGWRHITGQVVYVHGVCVNGCMLYGLGVCMNVYGCVYMDLGLCDCVFMGVCRFGCVCVCA